MLAAPRTVIQRNILSPCIRSASWLPSTAIPIIIGPFARGPNQEMSWPLVGWHGGIAGGGATTKKSPQGRPCSARAIFHTSSSSQNGGKLLSPYQPPFHDRNGVFWSPHPHSRSQLLDKEKPANPSIYEGSSGFSRGEIGIKSGETHVVAQKRSFCCFCWVFHVIVLCTKVTLSYSNLRCVTAVLGQFWGQQVTSVTPCGQRCHGPRHRPSAPRTNWARGVLSAPS